MGSNKGFIKLYRDIRQHWIWSDPEWVRAWIDLIMMANHEDKKVLFNGKLILVKRGTFITSIRKLAKQWGWTRGRTYDFLKALKVDTMIDTKVDTHKTIVTIVNYGKYQNRRDTKLDTDHTTETDTERTPNGHRPNTNKNIEEYIRTKEEDKEYTAPPEVTYPELEPGDEYEEGWVDP